MAIYPCRVSPLTNCAARGQAFQAARAAALAGAEAAWPVRGIRGGLGDWSWGDSWNVFTNWVRTRGVDEAAPVTYRDIRDLTIKPADQLTPDERARIDQALRNSAQLRADFERAQQEKGGLGTGATVAIAALAAIALLLLVGKVGK